MRRRVTRREVFELLSKARRTFTPDAVADLLVDHHQDPGQPEIGLPLALTERYRGVQNGHLSDIYEALTGERAEVVGDAGRLVVCPCCGYRTLHERFDSELGTGFDICEHCNWEDDGTSNVDTFSSPNRGSMAEYRKRLSEERNFFDRGRWARD